MSRGELTWKLTIPDSGVQPFAGLFLAFIEWDGEPHPSVNMVFPGPRLKSVVLRHPRPKELESVLQALGIAHLAKIEQARRYAVARFCFRTAGWQDCDDRIDHRPREISVIIAKYMIRRLGQVLVILFLIGCINFLVLKLAPGDLVDVLAGESGAARRNLFEEPARALRP